MVQNRLHEFHIDSSYIHHRSCKNIHCSGVSLKNHHSPPMFRKLLSILNVLKLDAQATLFKTAGVNHDS